jgi:hypothetical protein
MCIERVQMRVPTGAVACRSFHRQAPVVEDEDRRLPVGPKLDVDDRVALAGVPPEELEQALGLDREHLAAGDLTLVVAREAEHVPTAETQVELGVGEPPCEALGLGQRRPHLRRSRLVAARSRGRRAGSPRSSDGYVTVKLR